MNNKVLDYFQLFGIALLLCVLGFLLMQFNWARWSLFIILVGYVGIRFVKNKIKISQLKSKIKARFPCLQQEKNELLWGYLTNKLDLDRCSDWWEQDWVHKKLVNNLTLLHIVAGLGDTKNSAWLLTQKANPNAKDDKALTPLDYAKKFNEVETVKLLENYIAK